jgi:hypothetical protein
VNRRLIPWTKGDGGPLGRHVHHDERSWAYRRPATIAREDLRPVLHRRHGHIYDQGHLGSCTGNALAGALMTDPLYRPHHNYADKTAVKLYSRATALDGFDGTYPPDDTGSSGLAVCKAAQGYGMITSYEWAMGITDALAALQRGPVITGVNWYEGFDYPASNGLVRLSGSVRGGHEFVVRGYDPDAGEVLADQSWGPGYGLNGVFRILVADWARLLGEDGDVTIPVRA